jgi:transcriptional regulator with XRE-family HTH domain
MEPVTAFPYALSRLLQANGIKAADLAYRLACDVEHIEQLLKGISLPTPALLEAICRELNVVLPTMTELVRRDREMRLHRRSDDLRRKASA